MKIKQPTRLALLVLIYGILNMPMPSHAVTEIKDVEREGFSIDAIGGHDYGSNGIAVWLPNKIRIGLSDTIDKEFGGVGIIDAQLSPDDLKAAAEIHRKLCEAVELEPGSDLRRVDPPTQYSVTCNRAGRQVQHDGRLDELPSALTSMVHSFYLKARDAYVKDGRAIAKLDVTLDSIARQKDEFLISVKFINSGDYPMITLTPERWSGVWGESLLWLNAESTDGKAKWSANLSGLPLVNKSDFPNQTITIPARTSVIYKFLTSPTEKVRAGTYKVDVRVFMSVGGDYPISSMGKVDFHSDYANPAKVAIDRDYPSTPQEWKDYEERHRKEVAPVAPGASILEDGFYRAVSPLGERHALLREFKTDDAAPAIADLRLPHWVWEADPTLPVICERGQPCPREGRWAPRTVDNNGFTAHMQYERAFRTAEVMPTDTISGVDKRFSWAWLGA